MSHQSNARFPSAEAVLAAALGPRWAEPEDREAAVLAAAENIAEFVRRNGREPSNSSNNPEERRLGKKLHQMKRAARGQGMHARYPAAEEVLAAALGSRWAEPEDREAAAVAAAEEIAEFVRRNDREPSNSSNNPEERRLGKKLHQMKRAARGQGMHARYPAAEEVLAVAAAEEIAEFVRRSDRAHGVGQRIGRAFHA